MPGAGLFLINKESLTDAAYQARVLEPLIPWTKNRDFILQQDWASAHMEQKQI